MNLDKYNYELNEDRIAINPPVVRGSTRLLKLSKQTGDITDDLYANINNYLSSGDLLILNDTKVIKARLITKTDEGRFRELLILEKHSGNFDEHRFKVMYRRKIKLGQILHLGDTQLEVLSIYDDGTADIKSSDNLYDLAEQYGSVPLPPYMHRDADENDVLRYQTVFAHDIGSVAAPTASLNITDELLGKLKAKGVKITNLTLHVGLGTFMPIRVNDLKDHKMHKEYFLIPSSTVDLINETKASGKKVIAAGTTVTRALEYSADKIMSYDKDIAGEADIFIYPGYDFKIVDGLLTNFHAPKSTVLMMAAAFAGWDKLYNAYEHASKNGYKFLSYGDSMLII
jgi:S-adenosylmethionine:tRNA ribosyltransferase-isomerase